MLNWRVATTATLFNNVIIELTYDRLHVVDSVFKDVLLGFLPGRSTSGDISRDISTRFEPIYHDDDDADSDKR